ncbi:MAG: TolC family protein [Aliarcobacter sp.]|jgi:outer membrane protein TolC|nr:TolC family protein [Aliarcobacter sp.]
MKNNFLLLLLFLSINLYCDEKLTFSKAYNLTLKNSKKVESLNLKLDSSHENITQAESRFYPEIAFYTSYTKNKYSFDKYNKQINQEVTDYNIVLQQPIFDKTIGSQVDTENYRYKSYKNEVNYMKQELAKEILKIYLSLIQTKNRINMIQSYVDYIKAKRDLIEEQYNMKLSTVTEILEIDTEYNQANIDLENEKLLLIINKKKLTNFIGKNIDLKIPDLENLSFISNNLDNLKKTLPEKNEVDLNLQLDKFKNIIQTYKHEVRTAKYNHLPKVNLNLQYTKNIDVTNSSSFNSTFDENKEIIVNINVPIYKGGYLNSKEIASKLNVKSTEKELEYLQNELNQQYDELNTTLNWSIRSINLYKNALVTAKLFKKNIQKEYEYGLKSLIDLNEANYKILQLKDKYIENLSTSIDTYVSLLILTNSIEDLTLIDFILDS